MSEQAKRRVTIDLTAAAAKEVDNLKSAMGITAGEVFRHALGLLRLYVQLRQEGQEIYIVDPSDPSKRTRVEVPVILSKGDERGGRIGTATANR